VVGDSLSAGFGLNQQQAWPTLLDHRLQTQRLHYNVVNASISGDTSSGGRSRFSAALEQSNPVIVIIELGANDGLRGLPIDALRNNLSTMIRQAQAHNARVLLIGMKIPPNYGPLYVQQFEETFLQLATEYKTAFVPFFLSRIVGKRELFQNDHLHPTAEAQTILLDTVWEHLLPLLKTQETKKNKKKSREKTKAKSSL